jgi:hypothetical protein
MSMRFLTGALSLESMVKLPLLTALSFAI